MRSAWPSSAGFGSIFIFVITNTFQAGRGPAPGCRRYVVRDGTVFGFIAAFALNYCAAVTSQLGSPAGCPHEPPSAAAHAGRGRTAPGGSRRAPHFDDSN